VPCRGMFGIRVKSYYFEIISSIYAEVGCPKRSLRPEIGKPCISGIEGGVNRSPERLTFPVKKYSPASR
jgi:hypothetical protein